MTATAMSPVPGEPPSSGPAELPGGPPLTLPDEHMLLLWQVLTRAGDVLAAAARGRWPEAELAALAGYIRAEVLHQMSDEERLLFPDADPGTAGWLARDHARLRSSAESLARAAAGGRSMPLDRLTAATRDFVVQLQRHMDAEEDLLASEGPPGSVPATVTRGGRPHGWYSLTEGPVVDLDAVSPGQAVAAAVARLLRLRRGEQVELHSGADLGPVAQEMDRLSPGRYGFAILQDGPGRWRMRVTRRRAAG